ncbi:MAG: lysylphosphatidylglycerol synthase domain-containing protein [Actinomycetota bacterium]
MRQGRIPGRGAVSLWRVVRSVAAIALVGVIFVYFLPRIVDLGDVWAAISAMTWLELLTLGVLAVANNSTYWLVEVSARPGLSYRQAMKITQTSTAISNTLPGGAAFGAGLQTAMYVSYGFLPKDIAISMALTGIWNTFVKLAMPIVALALLVLGGSAGGALVASSLIGVLALVGAILTFAVILRSERGALGVGRRIGSLLALVSPLTRRSPQADWGAAAADFRRRTIDLLRIRWSHLTAAAILSHVTLYIVLLMTLRHVGVSNSVVSWQEALAAFAFVRLLSALPITPGGLGVVELGLTASLVAAGGEEALVVAAVLVYRLLTFVLPIPVGALSYFLWQHETARRRAVANT